MHSIILFIGILATGFVVNFIITLPIFYTIKTNKSFENFGGVFDHHEIMKFENAVLLFGMLLFNIIYVGYISMNYESCFKLVVL